MKKLITIFILIVITTNTQAQLGGLLKKAKEKSKEIINSTPSATNKATEQNTPSENETEKEANIETKWEEGYACSNSSAFIKTGGLSAEFIARGNGAYGTLKKFTPFRLIRKEGEEGTFHFAKDYPELVNLTEAYQPKINIEFAYAPFTNGTTASTTFTSAGHIYGKISALKGNLQQALQLSPKGSTLTLEYRVFGDEKIFCSNNIPLSLTEEDVKDANYFFDILPDLKYASYKGNSDIAAFITEHKFEFAEIQTQNVFPKSGTYAIGAFIENKLLDDWGKETETKLTHFGSFNYQFAIADVAKINEETAALRKKNYAANDEKALDEKVANNEVPDSWKKSSNPINSGFTQKELTDWAFQNEKVNLLKFYATEKAGMRITKNDLGIPDRKYYNQQYYFFYKNLSNNRCYFKNVSIYYDYAGAGTYNKTPYMNTIENIVLDCKKLN